MNIIQYHYPFIIFIDIPSKSFFSFHGLKAVWIDPKTLPVAILDQGNGERAQAVNGSVSRNRKDEESHWEWDVE